VSSEESKVLDELERFRDWASGAYSKQTVVAYISALRGYFNFYGGVPTLEDPEVEAEIAKEYIKEGTEAQRQKWTYALKAYYNFRGRPDIAAMIPKYRYAYSFARNIFPSYRRLWDSILRMGFPDSAVLGTAYALALRLREVPLLRLSDFRRKNCAVLVHREKGPGGILRDYLLPLSPCACELLSEYVGSRAGGDQPLFYNLERRPINVINVLNMWHRFQKVTGYDETFHSLRHTRATEIAERFGDAVALANFLGHRNINSAMKYIHLAGSIEHAEANYWHCDTDVPLNTWKWVPI